MGDVTASYVLFKDILHIYLEILRKCMLKYRDFLCIYIKCCNADTFLNNQFGFNGQFNLKRNLNKTCILE